MPSADPKAVAWQKKVGEFDGFIVVTPEYNHSIPGSLKNAFDQAYKEWIKKPVGFVGYGMMGAARAVDPVGRVALHAVAREVLLGFEVFWRFEVGLLGLLGLRGFLRLVLGRSGWGEGEGEEGREEERVQFRGHD